MATDLSKGEGRYPVLKVAKKDIPSAGAKNFSVGMRIATVSLYRSSKKDANYWDDFDPLPVQFATDKQITIVAALASYHEREWAILEERLQSFNFPYKEGVVKILEDGSDWEEFTFSKRDGADRKR